MNWLLLMLSILLSACSSLPVALQKAPAVDVQLTEVMKNISSHRNMPVRWGGTVIEVENEEHLTNIQLLYFPLNSDGSLRLNDPNQGRFVIQSPEFLDPALYVKGSEITVAGIVSAETHRIIGNKPIKLPVIAIQAIYLWPRDQQSGYSGYGYAPYNSGYYSYPYRGYGYPYGYYPCRSYGYRRY